MVRGSTARPWWWTAAACWRDALLTSGLIGLSACSLDEVDKPVAPDLSALAVAYQSPSGDLTQGDLDAVVRRARELREAVDNLGVGEALIDALEAARSELRNEPASAVPRGPSSPGLSPQAFEIRGEGFVRIRRICDGWGPMPMPDPAHGSIDLIAGFDERSLDPVVWGGMDRCRITVRDRQVLLGARQISAVRAFVGVGVPFQQLGDLPIIFELELDAEIEGIPEALNTDFRLVEPLSSTSDIEFRVQTGTGTVIARTNLDGLTAVNAANGFYDCDPMVRTCRNAVDGIELSF